MIVKLTNSTELAGLFLHEVNARILDTVGLTGAERSDTCLMHGSVLYRYRYLQSYCRKKAITALTREHGRHHKASPNLPRHQPG